MAAESPLLLAVQDSILRANLEKWPPCFYSKGETSMKRQEILRLLRSLGQRLAQREVTGEILIADELIILFDIEKPKYSTGIHSYYGGCGATIRAVAAELAIQSDLPANWLSVAVKELFADPSWHKKWLEYPGLRVYQAPLEYALAMEVVMGAQEAETIGHLIKMLGIKDEQVLCQRIEAYVSPRFFTAEMRMLVAQVLTEL